MASNIVKLRNIKRALAIREPNEATSYMLSGRISNFRTYKSFNFIDLIDGSSGQHLQVVVKRELLGKPELGAYITCLGHLVASKGPKQPIEFNATRIDWLGKCDPDSYPLAMSNQRLSNDWYRRYTHLRPKAAHFSALLRVRSELELSIHMVMKQMDFFRVHPPSLTSNDSEASSDLFQVKRSKVYQEPTRRQEVAHVDYDKDVDHDDHSSSGRAPIQSAGREVIDDALNGHNNNRGNINNGPCLHTLNNLQALQPATDAAAAEASRMGSLNELTEAEEHYDDTGDGDCDNDDNNPHEAGRRRLIREDYFNKEVFLITSAQLHLESLAGALSRVYSIAPCFRAENSISTRHLCEFFMFELEESNVTELELLMNRAESIVKFIAQFLAEVSEHKSDFHALLKRSEHLVSFERLARQVYIRMSYREALDILRNKCDGFTGNTSYGSDIGRLHEKRLLEHTNGVPIFITNYPKQLKPFYMKARRHGGEREVDCFDLIAPFGGEICGGSLREDCHQRLVANLEQHQEWQSALSQAQSQREDHRQDREQQRRQALRTFQWYLDTRRYGSFPHGGLGMGVERLLQSLLGIKNIRDTSAFPRWTGYCPM